jgi:sugar lactone lactonase YvrE
LYLADTFNDVVRKISPTGVLTRYAGIHMTSGTTGDDGPALSATLDSPRGLAVDSAGNVYIGCRNRVRRVAPNGTITLFAGSGSVLGDNGPATSALLTDIYGLAIDANDNLYIADSGARRVRKVSGGTITTVAGNGTSGYGDNVSATGAVLKAPYGVAIDPQGRLVIVDRDERRVRRVDGGMITTIAGTGNAAGFAANGDGGPALSAFFYDPESVSIDGAGNIYVADTKNNRIRKIDTTGKITAVAGAVDPEGTGPRMSARLAEPRALVVTQAGTFYAGGSSGTVEMMGAGNTWLEVVAGRYPQITPTGTLARYRDETFGDVGGVAVDQAMGKIYLTEPTLHQIWVVTMTDPAAPATWTIAQFANTTSTEGFADGPVASAKFREPAGLHLDGSTLYVADTGNHAIRAINLATNQVTTVAGIGATRGFFGDTMPATQALLYAPRAVTRCGNDLFIADSGNHRVRRVDATGTITTVLGDGTAASSGEGSPSASFPVNTPAGLACDASNNLYVTSTTTVRLVAASASGFADGTASVQTIYGRERDTFPASATACLTGLAVIDGSTVHVVDSCAGIEVALARVLASP